MHTLDASLRSGQHRSFRYMFGFWWEQNGSMRGHRHHITSVLTREREGINKELKQKKGIMKEQRKREVGG